MPWLLAQANALHIPLPDASVHCVVTSPPYWGLRDYGTGKWEGGNPACDHRIVDKLRSSREWGVMNPSRDDHPSHGHFYKQCCGKCGAHRVDDQLGLEPTPEAYVARMVEVFREVRRVLRDDGTLWLNLGDSYATNLPGNASFRNERNGVHYQQGHGRFNVPGLKPKDLVGIPWRTAFALQADGWYLRSDIIWAKSNPMPESVTDRPTKSHEYVFLLSKRPTYYFDAEAVREPQTHVFNGKMRPVYGAPEGVAPGGRNQTGRLNGGKDVKANPAGRNIRTVWTIPTRAYPGAHFATFPPKLVVPCIKAGCPKGGIVLDPFIGSGTTLIVAEALGRHGIGLDISREYLIKQAKRRLERPHARAIRSTQGEPDMPLFR